MHFDKLTSALEIQRCVSLIKDNLHILSYKIWVIKGGACFSPSAFLSPFSLFPLSSRPSTCRISLNGFILIFPPKWTKADQDSSLGMGTPLVLLDTLGHSSCLAYESGGKEEDLDYHIIQLNYS